jgi:hypothetical protein
MILTTVVYPTMREMIMNAHWIFFPRRAESVTAIAAEVISASTPVAYAPAARQHQRGNRIVTIKQIELNTTTSGRVAGPFGRHPSFPFQRDSKFSSIEIEPSP